MEKFTSVLQLVVSAGMLLWAAYMIVRLVAGGYDVFYAICFGIMAILGYFMLRLSIKELKGGEE